MQMTRHMHERMNQRAIRSELVALAMDIGEFEGDRYVLTCKTIEHRGCRASPAPEDSRGRA